jgi:5-deoxy-glucuronate isomerase
MKYTAENMLIRSKDTGKNGVFAEVSSTQAGWEWLNMAARRMGAGEKWAGKTDGYEYAHVIFGGKCNVHTSAGDFLNIGARKNVFEGKPYAVYLSRNTSFEIEALTDGFEVASCWVKTEEDHPAQLVTPETSAVELRGGENASRQINSILPPGFNC